MPMLARAGYAAWRNTERRFHLETMVISREEIELLAACGDGWEPIWHRLWVLLEERLQEMLMHGTVDEQSCSLKQRFRMLGDVHRAQDFIAELLVQFHRKAELGSLLTAFEGEPDKLLAFLTSPTWVRGRALDFMTTHARVGITGMPGGEAEGPAVHRLEDYEAGVNIEDRPGTTGGVDAMRVPILINWDPGNGVDARVRMAAMQCWGRLDPSQEGLQDLEKDLDDEVRASEGMRPLETLLASLASARAKLCQRLAKIDQSIVDAPGMQRPKREELDAQRVELTVDLLLKPLGPGDVQALLGLPSADAAYQQLSRYRKAFPVLFSAIRDRLEGLVGQQ